MMKFGCVVLLLFEILSSHKSDAVPCAGLEALSTSASPPLLHLASSGFTVTITAMVPAVFNGSNINVSIQHDGRYSSCSNHHDNDIITVVNQMTSGSSPVTVMDTLSCRYAGRRVTYCLQFRTDECQSNVATETIEMPSLLSGLPVLTSPAPNTLSMSVDVDEQTNCVGVDRIMIEAAYFYPAYTENVTKYRYYAEANIAFADTDVVFDSVPPGQVEFICGINIEDVYEDIATRCATTVDDITSTTVVGVSVGVVCSVCFLLIGVLIGVLATVTSHKCKKASHEGQSAAAPPSPVYEEMKSRQERGHPEDSGQLPGNTFHCEENVAYGQSRVL